MVNALHSSRENGTKAFLHQGTTFGWIDIYKMWMRECERREHGHARMVPKLRETHIIRDAWQRSCRYEYTYLLCQCALFGILHAHSKEVLSKLYRYSHQTPAPRDSLSAKLALSYLEACNKIFERGLLSHDKVASTDCQVVRNIHEGYQFYTKWLDQIYETGD